MDLKKIKLFSDLEEGELEQIKKMAQERVYPKGATVFVGGQEANGLYVIYSGRVKALILYPDGREKTLAVMGEGEILGEVTLYGSGLRSATIEALETTTFVIIPRDSFQSLLMCTPGLCVRIIELLSQRLRRANKQIEELTFLNARSRVICGLICFAEEHGCEEGGETQILFHLTHEELGKFTAVSRETVTKVLNELKEKKLIHMTRGRIKVLKMTELKRQVI